MSEQDQETTGEENVAAGSGAATEVALRPGDAPAQYKMTLGVEITDVGPCKKHIRVQIPRSDIDHYYNTAVKDLVGSAVVPGFRPGHVPRKLIEKRFRKEVGDSVRQRVLMESLEQLADEHELDAINEPTLDVDALLIPDEGDFTYEFDVEVRPEFDLPDYNGLKIKRPVHEVVESEVEEYVREYLEQFGQLVPHDGPAESGDFLVVNVFFKSGEKEIWHSMNQEVRIRPVLEFTDAALEQFGAVMSGVVPGETREMTTTVSTEAGNVAMRGEPMTIRFEILDVKRLRMPELTPEFLETLSVKEKSELDGAARNVLERQVRYEQRQSTRRQVLEQITESASWELPESLVTRQVENALHRELLEMQQAGYTEEQIRARENVLRQEQVTMTRQALKEHFVLNKIATEEKLEVTPHDFEVEIAAMAQQRGESPRKMRARLEKQELMENLSAQILERKAVDFVLERAVFEDSPTEQQPRNQSVALAISVCGMDEVSAETAAESTSGAKG